MSVPSCPAGSPAPAHQNHCPHPCDSHPHAEPGGVARGEPPLPSLVPTRVSSRGLSQGWTRRSLCHLPELSSWQAARWGPHPCRGVSSHSVPPGDALLGLGVLRRQSLLLTRSSQGTAPWSWGWEGAPEATALGLSVPGRSKHSLSPLLTSQAALLSAGSCPPSPAMRSPLPPPRGAPAAPCSPRAASILPRGAQGKAPDALGRTVPTARHHRPCVPPGSSASPAAALPGSRPHAQPCRQPAPAGRPGG